MKNTTVGSQSPDQHLNQNCSADVMQLQLMGVGRCVTVSFGHGFFVQKMFECKPELLKTR
jgi:hypothetical protein